MTQARLEFWFDFASTYSYLSAMRLGPLAQKSGVKVVWRPFLLGPIFAAQGWTTSPFRIYPAKGHYMWRDMTRRTQALGLPLKKLDNMPQNSVLAARVAQLALGTEHGVAFCQAVFSAQFGQGRDIAEVPVIRDCLEATGLSGDLVDRAAQDDNRLVLRRSTEEAMARGIFGAPSFIIQDELFWGDDRLEEALDWAARHA
ncbi:2-hydroxychromene-2-carboxylate isomerase [uncultured Roseovarius sp.]|uniref:2-hydroxychromene-2-carboxylate isomerase n=1 Tax=Roseovarius sp. TaxID=1486281 RepID=UPI0025DC5EE2|nr:2-hydroxychromene-2-carboxylate isomerase [uncultured Roseovarius sp.]